YFLLTGRSPFAGKSALETLMAHLYEPPAPPRDHRPDVPADLEAAVLRCLAKNPRERYPDAESLDRALAHCAGLGPWTEEQAGVVAGGPGFGEGKRAGGREPSPLIVAESAGDLPNAHAAAARAADLVVVVHRQHACLRSPGAHLLALRPRAAALDRRTKRSGC